MPAQERAEDRGVDPGGIGALAAVPDPRGVHRVGTYGFVERAVLHQGLPPAPTRVMISQSARSSNICEVGIRTVVLCLPVTGWPARLVQ